MAKNLAFAAALAACLALQLACSSAGEPATPSPVRAEEAGSIPAPGTFQAPEAAPSAQHVGPPVAAGPAGPARFVAALNGAYAAERARELLFFADRFFRAPGSDGFEATVGRIHDELREAGFGTDPRLELELVEVPVDGAAWTPQRASLTLLRADGERIVLHGFEDQSEPERVMLPRNAPACDVTGELAFSLGDANLRGKILVTETRVRPDLCQRAAKRGAVAIVSGSLASYNMDASGGESHLDSIQYRVMAPGVALPICQVTPRTYRQLTREKLDRGSVRLRLEAEVKLDERPATAVVARIVGAERPQEAVVVVSHVDQPGASDNASGISSSMGALLGLTELLESGALPWPDRSLVFLFGREIQVSARFLDTTELEPVAGFAAILTGDSFDATGAVSLLERTKDPGAVLPLLPDEHTAWGAGVVEEEELVPDGLAVIARCAMLDVANREPGGWHTADHPWEGGTDHDQFLERGVPCVLFWHFAEFQYHTSLDRAERIDLDEVRRTGVAVLAAALAVADPGPGDLERYLASVELERSVRLYAAERDDEPEIVVPWRAWCDGAQDWLERVCAVN